MAETISDDEIRKILRDYPAAISLFDEVRGFYGDYLTIKPHEDERPSQAAIEPEDSGLCRAYLRITTAPTRPLTATIIHELLHLNHWQYGIPFKYGLAEKAGWSTENWNRGVEEILNAIEHLSFFDRFIQIGIPADLFLGRMARLDTEADRARMERCRQRRPLDVCRAFCAVQYFVFSNNPYKTDPTEMRSYAQMAIDLGLLTNDDIAFMQEWIARGEFSSAIEL